MAKDKVNPERSLIIIAKSEGLDSAMSVAKALGFTKHEAWAVIGKNMFPKK